MYNCKPIESQKYPKSRVVHLLGEIWSISKTSEAPPPWVTWITPSSKAVGTSLVSTVLIETSQKPSLSFRSSDTLWCREFAESKPVGLHIVSHPESGLTVSAQSQCTQWVKYWYEEWVESQYKRKKWICEQVLFSCNLQNLKHLFV